MFRINYLVKTINMYNKMSKAIDNEFSLQTFLTWPRVFNTGNIDHSILKNIEILYIECTLLNLKILGSGIAFYCSGSLCQAKLICLRSSTRIQPDFAIVPFLYIFPIHSASSFCRWHQSISIA